MAAGIGAVAAITVSACGLLASPEDRLIDDVCDAFVAQDVERYSAAIEALSAYAEEGPDPASVQERVIERCPEIQAARDAIEQGLEDRQDLADRQEQRIQVRVTACSAERATGTITNGNAEATRVSIVIYFTLRGSMLLTGSADAAPIGAGETQTWTAEATGGEVVLSPADLDALVCEVESIVAFPQ